MTYTHIEARTIIDIPTFHEDSGEKENTIWKYDPDNPLHDPTICDTWYAIYGKKDNMWVCLVDTHEFEIAQKVARFLSKEYQVSLTQSNLIDAYPEEVE